MATLDVEDTQGSLSVKYGRKVAVVVGHVERVDKVWVTPRKKVQDLSKELSSLCFEEACEKASSGHFSLGNVLAAKFSGDELYYRCKIVEDSRADGLVLVRFINFGNKELVAEMYKLPGNFSVVAPLAVQVQLDGMTDVPDTDKNRIKVVWLMGWLVGGRLCVL